VGTRARLCRLTSPKTRSKFAPLHTWGKRFSCGSLPYSRNP
jgi:hypothetical protein